MHLKTSKKRKVSTITNSTKTHISKQKQKRQHSYVLKKHLRERKYKSKQKKTVFLCAQETSEKKKVYKQTKKTAFLYA